MKVDAIVLVTIRIRLTPGIKKVQLVFLLGIFRRAPCPSDNRGRPLVPLYFPGGALPLKFFVKNLLVIYDTSSIRKPPKVSCPFFKFFLVRCKLPFFVQNCSLPFSLRNLDIPALLKSWKKHYQRSSLQKICVNTSARCYIITCTVFNHTQKAISLHFLPVNFQLPSPEATCRAQVKRSLCHDASAIMFVFLHEFAINFISLKCARLPTTKFI
jgi:hypothetical protein